MNDSVFTAAKILWDYHLLHHTLEKSDCILALGSHDLRVAERTAEIYLAGYAPIVIMSGGLGNFTRDLWQKKEADMFAEVAVKMGVPPEAILIENQSANTGENILFTKKLLQERDLDPQRLIVVQKPYMERRSYATFKKHWPEKELLLASPQVSFENYPTNEIPIDKVINIMVGDLHRIIEYPKKGFQIPQQVPAHVLCAFDELIKAGYDKHLAK